MLGVPIEYFFEGLERDEEYRDTDEAAGAGNFEIDILSTAEGIQLNSAFFAIGDPKLRRRLLELVKALAGTADKAENPDSALS